MRIRRTQCRKRNILPHPAWPGPFIRRMHGHARGFDSRIIQWLRKEKNPHYVLLPREEYLRRSKAWDFRLRKSHPGCFKPRAAATTRVNKAGRCSLRRSIGEAFVNPASIAAPRASDDRSPDLPPFRDAFHCVIVKQA